MNGKHAGEEYKGKDTKLYRVNDRGAAVSQPIAYEKQVL